MPSTNQYQNHDYWREKGRHDCPMTPECVERLLSKIDAQGSQLDELVSTVSEIRDFYIIIKALMPIVKYVALISTCIGALIVYYLATGDLPVKQIIDILLKVANGNEFIS